MTEKELNQLGLLEEFLITELEQRLEFEAWCDSCETNSQTCHDTNCTAYCGGGGGGGGDCGSEPGTLELCIIEPC